MHLRLVCNHPALLYDKKLNDMPDIDVNFNYF